MLKLPATMPHPTRYAEINAAPPSNIDIKTEVRPLTLPIGREKIICFSLYRYIIYIYIETAKFKKLQNWV